MGGEIRQTGMTKEGIRKALAQRKKHAEQIPGYVPAAVLLPLFERSGEYHLVFTKRTETVNYHKGQISFPGGRPHPYDRSLLDTALRETWEASDCLRRMRRFWVNWMTSLPTPPASSYRLLWPPSLSSPVHGEYCRGGPNHRSAAPCSAGQE